MTKPNSKERTERIEQVRREIAEALEEREAVVKGKARVSPEEVRAYNKFGKDILDLRRQLYRKQEKMGFAEEKRNEF